MYRPRHVRARHHWLAGVGVMVVIVAVVAGVSLSQNHDGSPRAHAPVAGTTTSAPAGPSSAALLACRRAYGDQAAALRAASRSLEQWQVHVGAMNRLVAGKITLAQATQFWNRTRIGAAHRVADFLAVDRGVAGRAARCESAGRLVAGGARSSAAAACVRSVGAREQALGSARRAVATWQMHIHDMEMLRTGRLSPARATRMWLANWRKGVAELGRYHVAARRSVHAAGCPAA